MTTAAVIAIKLEAQTAQLKRELVNTRKQISKSGQAMGKAFGASMIKFNAAIGVVKTALSGVQGIVNTFFESIERNAALGDFADRIGATAEELQKLRFAAEQTGGSAGVMDTALQRMSRRLADAAKAGGPLAARLKAMGLDAEKLADQSITDQVKAFSDALKDMSTVGEQNAAIMALMDTEGVALSATLRGGSEAMAAYLREAEQFGIVSNQNVKAAQTMSAELKKIKQQWQDTKDQIALSAGPGVIWWMKKWSEGIQSLRREWDYWFGRGSTGLSAPPVIAKATEALEEAAEAAGDLKAELTDIAALDMAGGIESVGVAAARRGTAAGAAAVAEGKRIERERQAWQKDVLAHLRELIETTAASTVELLPVELS